MFHNACKTEQFTHYQTPLVLAAYCRRGDPKGTERRPKKKNRSVSGHVCFLLVSSAFSACCLFSFLALSCGVLTSCHVVEWHAFGGFGLSTFFSSRPTPLGFRQVVLSWLVFLGFCDGLYNHVLVLLQFTFEASQSADGHGYASISQFIVMCNMQLNVFNDLARANRRGTEKMASVRSFNTL